MRGRAASSGLRLPRGERLAALAEAAARGPATLLIGPAGSGKSWLLRELADALRASGWLVAHVDLLTAAASPERFVELALGALPVEGFADQLPRATRIRELAGAGRDGSPAAVAALLELWADLARSGDRPVALLLDEIGEMRSLATFSGMRDIEERVADRLAARRRGTIAATSYPGLVASAARWPRLEAGLDEADLEELELSAGERAALLAASGGLAGHAVALLEALDSEGVAAAWARAMAPGERLEVACRAAYESLLLRSRGYGMAKVALAAVADSEGANLTQLVARVGRTPGAVRDYLGWLLEVGALRMVRKRYYFEDPVLRAWVRLYGRGRLPDRGEREREAQRLEPAAAVPAAFSRRADESLIEID